MPGVLAVLTGADVRGRRARSPMPHIAGPDEPARHPLPNRTARRTARAHELLATDRGALRRRAVAIVVAETLAPPRTPPRRCRSTMRCCRRHRSPTRWPAAPPGRRSGECLLDADVGDRRPPRRRSRAPTHSCGTRHWVQRVTGVPLEPRAAVGDFDAGDGQLHASRRLRRRGAAEARARASSSASRPSRCGSIAAMSAAISAPATPSIPSSRWWPGRRAARPAGEMDLRALRGVPQRLPGPRSGDRGRAGARRRRPLPRPARPEHSATPAPIPRCSCRWSSARELHDQRLPRAGGAFRGRAAC